MVKMYGLGKQAYLNSSFNCFDCIVSPTAPHTRTHTHTQAGANTHFTPIRPCRHTQTKKHSCCCWLPVTRRDEQPPACVCVRWYVAAYLKFCGPSSSRAHRLASACCELSGYWGSSKSPSESAVLWYYCYSSYSYHSMTQTQLNTFLCSACFSSGTGHPCATSSCLCSTPWSPSSACSSCSSSS